MKIGSPDELKGMTVSGLETLIIETMKLDKRFGVEYSKNLTSKTFADYKRTLDKILEEHQKDMEMNQDGRKD